MSVLDIFDICDGVAEIIESATYRDFSPDQVNVQPFHDSKIDELRASNQPLRLVTVTPADIITQNQDRDEETKIFDIQVITESVVGFEHATYPKKWEISEIKKMMLMVEDIFDAVTQPGDEPDPLDVIETCYESAEMLSLYDKNYLQDVQLFFNIFNVKYSRYSNPDSV
jgi:hypothetical protein